MRYETKTCAVTVRVTMTGELKDFRDAGKAVEAGDVWFAYDQHGAWLSQHASKNLAVDRVKRVYVAAVKAGTVQA